MVELLLDASELVSQQSTEAEREYSAILTAIGLARCSQPQPVSQIWLYKVFQRRSCPMAVKWQCAFSAASFGLVQPNRATSLYAKNCIPTYIANLVLCNLTPVLNEVKYLTLAQSPMLQAQRTKRVLTQTLREHPRSATAGPAANGVPALPTPPVAVVEHIEEEIMLVPAANRAPRDSLADFQV